MLIDAATLRDRLLAGGELAVLDAREQGAYSNRHLLRAVSLPLSQLELQLEALVPRRTTPLVWCDGGADDGTAGLAQQAADRCAALGWSDVSVLDGGTAAWAAAGGELYAGVNVVSKAFGELIEHRHDTPRLGAEDVARLRAEGADLVVLDSRPFNEYRRMAIPDGIDCPGAELVHRARGVAPDPSTLVVVNCAGRTRSIIGAQSLINAGLPNEVMALENGTMGWQLAGLDIVAGAEAVAPTPSPEVRSWAAQAAAGVAERFGVTEIEATDVEAWLADNGRTTYLFDVRSPEEFAEGHLAGSRSAPGGQLVQATDTYVGTNNARLVLIDDDGVRATM
ncbi:MAG: rhodanese-like domain-containing protein, partial [Actinomycetota bacterium]